MTKTKDKTTDPHKQVHGNGGVSNKDRLTYGRNMARVVLQRKSKKVPATGI